VGQNDALFRHLRFALKQEKINGVLRDSDRDSGAILGSVPIHEASGPNDRPSYPSTEFVRGRNPNVIIVAGPKCG